MCQNCNLSEIAHWKFQHSILYASYLHLSNQNIFCTPILVKKLRIAGKWPKQNVSYIPHLNLRKYLRTIFDRSLVIFANELETELTLPGKTFSNDSSQSELSRLQIVPPFQKNFDQPEYIFFQFNNWRMQGLTLSKFFFRRTKVPKISHDSENVVRWKFCSPKMGREKTRSICLVNFTFFLRFRRNGP